MPLNFERKLYKGESTRCLLYQRLGLLRLLVTLVHLLPNAGLVHLLADVDTRQWDLHDIPVGQRDLDIFRGAVSHRVGMLLRDRTTV